MAIRQATTPQHDAGTVLERKEQALKPPAMYKVLLLNDDYTPMEFVVMILQQYFSKDRETATQIMLTVHREGKGVCGIYTRISPRRKWNWYQPMHGRRGTPCSA